MNRRAFNRLSAAALMCAPALIQANQPQNVTIIGAGSSGLSAAYHLEKSGINTRILEASSRWGGRIKRLSDFSALPLDLGAEWIHDDPTVLGRIIGEVGTDLGVETIEYSPRTYQFWHKGKLSNFNALRYAYEEVKFLDTTWYGFFEQYVLPRIGGSIEYNAPVSQIRSDGAGVAVYMADGRKVETDKVIVTVPLSVLQLDQISFSGDLLPPNLAELQNIDFGGGFKVFLKFSERFYPDILLEGSRLTGVLADSWSSKLYYDATFGKPTNQHILGLFTVSDGTLLRADLNDRAIIDDVLSELTEIFGPVVKRAFIDGVVQNWSQEPYIMGSYSMSNHSELDVADILAPVAGKVFFAGEALGGDAQSTVHGAAFSAITAVEQIKTS